MRRKLFLATAILTVVFVWIVILGLDHYPCDPHDGGQKERKEQLFGYYRYLKEEINARKEKIKDKKKYSVYRVEFPIVFESNQEAETIRIDYYQAKKSEKRPAILITPAYRGENIFAQYVARYFASHGINGAIVHRGKKAITETEDLDAVEVFLKNTIIKNRQVVDWLIQQEEVDQERLGSFGISLGAIKNVITAGVEPRLKYHVFALAGGNLADIVCYSNLRDIKKWRRRIMQGEGINLAQLHQDFSRKAKSDPIILGEYVDARNVLMFIASYDRVVPGDYAQKLWQKIGKPEVIYLPFGHATSVPFLPYARAKSLEFFQECFGIH
jgi:hypothetical protein